MRELLSVGPAHTIAADEKSERDLEYDQSYLILFTKSISCPRLLHDAKRDLLVIAKFRFRDCLGR